jgi:hypothetical protein
VPDFRSLVRSRNTQFVGRGLAASDFFFGYLKEKLTDYDCTTREELKQAIIGIFNGLAPHVPESVVPSWMTRLRGVNEHHEESYRN